MLGPSVAACSNSWAGSGNALRAENWRVIGEARGDAEDARQARELSTR